MKISQISSQVNENETDRGFPGEFETFDYEANDGSEEDLLPCIDVDFFKEPDDDQDDNDWSWKP